ncbi:hypothetical protein [uncultured Clostridium sp.]|uniref:hypothetical protein n=1 Tax=uncultured Clostridium sp. TaxID=59620 RepID=UPI00258A1AAB|nr:hypothetical protein [uncultured Clostridium sp.]MDU1348259.1 hypothetical protein [Clostridium argentinense]
MAKYTKNYNLKKPEQEDFYNIDDQNDNWDIIDSELAESYRVKSVNEKTGDVVLKASDINLNNGRSLESQVEIIRQSFRILRNRALPSSSWTQVDATLWKLEIESPYFKSTSVVDVNIQQAYINNAKFLKGNSESSDGKVTIFATKKPTGSLRADIAIWDEVV